MEKMDSDLLDLIGRSRDIVFLTPLIEEKESPRHYLCERNGKTIVQMSLSGTQRFLGDFCDVEPASRFADMATLRFKKYRHRIKWNYSEAQAIADTANVESCGGELANHILACHQNRLRQEGMLKEVTQASRRPEQEPHRRTVHSRLAALELPIDSRFDLIAALESRLADLEAAFSKLRADFSALDDAHSRTLASLASLQGPVVVPPIHTTDPIPAYEPVFYPNVTCTGPDPSLHITNTPSTIWKA